MSEVMHREMALGPIGPIPLSLLTHMSSSNMAIFFRRGAIATLLRP
jgi:hypothetical protein